MDTLLVTPSPPRAYEESLNRCAHNHCVTSALGRISERRNQNDQSHLLGISHLQSPVRPVGGSYWHVNSRYNDDRSNWAADLDKTVLIDDPGFFVRQIRSIINSVRYFLVVLFKSSICRPWNWVKNVVVISGFKAKLAVFAVLMALIFGGSVDYTEQNLQKSTQQKSASLDSIRENKQMENEKPILNPFSESSNKPQAEIKLRLYDFKKHFQETAVRVEKIEVAQSQLQLEMRNIIEQMKTFKQDIRGFVQDLPQKDLRRESEGQQYFQNRVRTVEAQVGSLETSVENITEVINTISNERVVVDRRLSKISKQLSNFTIENMSSNLIVDDSALNSLQSSFSDIERSMVRNISEITSTHKGIADRVVSIEEELKRITTYQSKAIAQEKKLESTAPELWISQIHAHSPTYGGLSSWFYALGRTFGGLEVDAVKNVGELLKTVEKPGDCWPMQGDSGFVEFEIPKPRRFTGVSIFHIPESMSPDLKTAPREFRIKARLKSSTLWTDLGEFEYRLNDTQTQQFNFFKSGLFQILRLEIISNHGSKEYTCIYQFRVYSD